MTTVKLVVAYDGGPFHGFAVNEGVPTVGGTLQANLSRVLGHDVQLSVAGRTDKGVHAWGQVVSFTTERDDLDPAALRHALNGLGEGTIVVRDAAIVADDFDARFSATARRYRYTILNRPYPDPFIGRTTWWVDRPLDLHALQIGCDALIGQHDFSSFCRRPKPGDHSMVRRLIDARWTQPRDDVLRFEVEANAFCHQMVRSIVGTLVEMGLGKKKPGEMAGIIRSRERSAAGQMAPARGLCLWLVRY